MTCTPHIQPLQEDEAALAPELRLATFATPLCLRRTGRQAGKANRDGRQAAGRDWRRTVKGGGRGRVAGRVG